MADDMTNGKHVAILRVSRQLLVQVLGLPIETVVDGAQISFDQPDVIELRIRHEDLPLVGPGAVLPKVTAELRSETVEGPARETRFVRWVL
jgi:hypothetical protein